MSSKFAINIALLLVGTILPYVAIAAGSAKGQMTIDGKSISLSNAHAIEEQGSRGESYVRVIVSDQPISDDDIKIFPDVLLKAINAGKLNALSFLVVENNDVNSLDIYSSAIGEGGTSTLKLGNLLELKSRDSSHVSGRIHIASPHKFDETGSTFSYDVTFDAPIDTHD